VTVTTALFQELAGGAPVMVDTTEDATGHVHTVTLTCA
jgi:hypothetical protein